MTDLVYQTTLGGNLTLRATNTASNPIITIPAVTANMVTTGDTGTVTTAMLTSNAATQSSYNQGGTGSVSRTIQTKLQEFLSVLDFGADPTGVADSTTAIQNAINYAQTLTNGTPATVSFPAGTFKITTSLNVTKAISIIGQSFSTTIINLVSASEVPAFNVNSSSFTILGGGIFNLRINCNSTCKGIQLVSTAVYPVTRMVFENIWIVDATSGVYINSGAGNTVYSNRFVNILVTGNVTKYGFYSNGGAYNEFDHCEATGITNTAWAIYMTQAGSVYTNIAVDGVCFINDPFGLVNGFVIETINASSPISTIALKFNAILNAQNITLIDIDNSKCTYGINLGSANINLSDVNITNISTTAPYYTLIFDTSASGVICNYYQSTTPTYLLEQYVSATLLASFKFINCGTVTKVSNLGSNLVSSLPTAGAVYEGNMLTLQNGSGVANHLYVCLKNSSNAYVWVQIG
jgi:hypothetical protein